MAINRLFVKFVDQVEREALLSFPSVCLCFSLLGSEPLPPGPGAQTGRRCINSGTGLGQRSRHRTVGQITAQ